MALHSFHPVLKHWFETNLGQPTPAQSQAWPAIQQGKHTLIAAPTGSGKTLAAFYAVINSLVVEGLENELPQETRVVYVSPLKALSNDIHRNLEVPLRGIEQQLPSVKINVAVRTGDTSAKERQQMLKKPPHILVTTPESLYLLLTSEGGRKMLRHVRTLIIDEIHAVLGAKRGSHLALSLERLGSLTQKPLQRIGLSATQKPIELVAKFLVGSEKNECVIVDTGHRRKLDLRLEVPKSPLTAVMSNEVWSELYERLVELIKEHKTTLIFVNTRRLAERLARGLAERIGETHVSSHHGSMSKEHRHMAERRLKAGELKVLVATASMELGIDIGSVELVVQFSSPKRIAAFLQRVGRSGHFVGGIPKGIMFPLSRDELVECAALLDSVRRGELDKIEMPEEPLDILSQQIVAEAASQEWSVQNLFQLFRKAYPYRNLTEEKFLSLIKMLSEGYTSKRGRRGAYLHYDAIHGQIRARRGARLVAITNGGSIPDMFDYEVVLQPEGITVGTLNEDFALESLAGDIFTLGTHSWQLIRIEGLKVLVHDAAGKPPTVPFWLGESSARSNELSESVSRLRETISTMLDEEPYGENHPAVRWLVDEVGIDAAAADQLVSYLWMGKVGLGLMPLQKTIVAERFFDEGGDMHLVIHSPYGSRVNRGWGLALRKKFCRKFNFELQAAANENSIILSLSSSHSFPLDEIFHYLNSKTVRQTLCQAMLDAPLFEIRWRTNATRSLAILRNRGGKRVPPHLQRMQAEDLIAQVFPDQIACAENLPREIEIPKHPLVDQVVHDCLTEAMDIETLEDLMRKIEKGEVEIIAKDLREPSVFAQEIINARPYAFLDDVEFAQRRVNAIRNRGWLDPAEAKELSQLDPEAIKRVKEEAWPQARNPDELHDALMIHGFVTESEGSESSRHPREGGDLFSETTEPDWKKFFEFLIEQGRATRFHIHNQILWVAAERLSLFQMIYPEGKAKPALKLPESLMEKVEREDALREITRGRLEALGPVTVSQLSRDASLPEEDIQIALMALENEGFVFRGKYNPEVDVEQWCERRLLQRIHRTTLESLRESIQPVTVQDFMRFLFKRHGLDLENEEKPTGPDTLLRILEQLEGFEAPASAWESNLIPARMSDYDPIWLDVLCISGKVVWGRFNLSKTGAKSGPVKNSPMSIVSRTHLNLWKRLTEVASRPSVARNDKQSKSSSLGHCEERSDEATSALSTKARKILDYLKTHGASFFDDFTRTGLLRAQIEEGIGELVSNGLVVSDSFSGLRALLTPQANRSGKGRRGFLGIENAGRWSLVHSSSPNGFVGDQELRASGARQQLAGMTIEYEQLEEIIWIYLKRWGVLFRSIIEKESFAPPWRILVRVLRRMELRGDLRGGRFVSQVSGEQFALPETVEDLRKVKNIPHTGKLISISATDPLNLLGTILPAGKISKLTSNRIVFQEGIPLAVLEGKEVHYLKELPTKEAWRVHTTLVKGNFPPKLRYYLGRA